MKRFLLSILLVLGLIFSNCDSGLIESASNKNVIDKETTLIMGNTEERKTGAINNHSINDVLFYKGEDTGIAISMKDAIDENLDVTNSAILGDVTTDLDNTENIVGEVYLFWSYKTVGPVWSSPSLGDVDGDGKIEVVIGSWDAFIYAIKGENGNRSWSFPTNGEMFSSPALGDIDGDGKLEVVAESRDSKLRALNVDDGCLLWSFEWALEMMLSLSINMPANFIVISNKRFRLKHIMGLS